MRDTRERPACHRAEDLVTYLYGEGSEADALDFGRHLQQCDACRGEFRTFNQVHDSIQLWRNEALGASLNLGEVAGRSTIESPQFVRPRKLSAMAALREFFSVSPLWLRGATVFAALLLCVLGIVMVTRISTKPVTIANVNDEKTYTQKELEAAVNKAVDLTRQELTVKVDAGDSGRISKQEPRQPVKLPQIAADQRKAPRPHSLNRQERQQLAADLRLTLPVDEEEILLALPEQDIPHQ
jgi:anti-sigma factor RsiW